MGYRQKDFAFDTEEAGWDSSYPKKEFNHTIQRLESAFDERQFMLKEVPSHRIIRLRGLPYNCDENDVQIFLGPGSDR